MKHCFLNRNNQQPTTIRKIVVIGSGRVAWHLGKRLKARGLPVAQVVSRTAEHARALAGVLGARWTDDASEVLPDAGWLLIAVRDDAIAEVAAALAPHAPGALATHTSGATPGMVLQPFFKRHGVFYPLQSFSLEHSPVWSKIPFCVDASSDEDALFLEKMAGRIGKLVYRVDDAQRSILHVAAVFANNFANHCFAVADKLLAEKDLPFEMLHPLMEETLAKALLDAPARMQTGPALRGDAATVKRHLELLKNHPGWRELYAKMTRSINPDLPF
ncbi:MAG: DUF2520 domain-containing protein [Haliscomenobacteraceae bacterium CHB4]|nr:hypothetical protein [Saprospiraceae bacterium]MCE7921961.1 DUF2520 domain-containing protein [Haliscomenobacteraceae bacterium CHB4]